MAKDRLKNVNGKFVESDYEEALISLIEREGWSYLFGEELPRESKKDVLYMDDLYNFLGKAYPDLDNDDKEKIANYLLFVGGDSDYATLHKVYDWLVNGMQFVTKQGKPLTISFIDFDTSEEHTNKNIYRIVNQFSVEYVNNGETKTRRPDVLLYINGIPVCIFELKNPTNPEVTIYDAWKQILHSLLERHPQTSPLLFSCMYK